MKKLFKTLTALALSMSLIALGSLSIYASNGDLANEPNNTYSTFSTTEDYSKIYTQSLYEQLIGGPKINTIPSSPFVDLDIMIYCASTEMYDIVKSISGDTATLPVNSTNDVLFGEGSTSYRGADNGVEVISYQFLLYSDGTLYERTWLQYEGDSITEDDWYNWHESENMGIGYYSMSAVKYFEMHTR